MKKNSKSKINVLFVGHGARGAGILPLLLEMEDVNVVGVSDIYADRMKAAAEAVRKARGTKPAASQDYRSLLDIKGLDAVLTPSSWTSRVQVALDVMNAQRSPRRERRRPVSAREDARIRCHCKCKSLFPAWVGNSLLIVSCRRLLFPAPFSTGTETPALV